MAISTLRMKRSRPVRLTGEPEKSLRNAASSRRASSASLRRHEIVARGELRLARGFGKFVPRADREAIVAAIDAIADGFAEFARDMSLMLDGEIGNAAARIELIGRREGLGRTDVETGAA